MDTNANYLYYDDERVRSISTSSTVMSLLPAKTRANFEVGSLINIVNANVRKCI